MSIDLLFKILSIWLFLVCVTQKVKSFQETSVLSLLTKVSRVHNGTNCLGLLRQIDDAGQENAIWAYKMFDASGSRPPNFMWGNNYLLGIRDACRWINNYENEASIVLSSRYKHRHTPELLDEKPPFPVNYRVIYAETFSQYQIDMQTYPKNILHFGVCVPQACSDQELANLMDLALNDENLGENDFKMFDNSEFLNATVLYSKTLVLRKHFFVNWSVILLLCVVVFHLLIVLACTIIDVNIAYMPDYLKAFSLKHNWNEFLDRTKTKHEHDLTVVHGIKVISMFWIILAHIAFFAMASVSNLPMILPFMTRTIRQTIFTSPISVDSFFAISSFLMSYHLFKQKQNCPKFNLSFLKTTKMVIHRYLRFTPAYAVAILLLLVVSMIMNDVSPYYMIEDNEKNCGNYWWRNLLYVNNLFPLKEMCMSWSWYLSVELQCFSVGVLLMMIYYKNKSVGLILAFLMFKFSLFNTSMKAIKSNYALSLDVQYHTLEFLYFPFTTRIGAYIIGMLSGHFLSVQKSDLQVPKWFITFLNFLSIFSLLFVIHIHSCRQESKFVGPFLAGFGRIVWAWAICWIIISCSTGNMKRLNNFLTKDTFFVFSKLTYSVYLLNPICVIAIAMMMETPIHLAPTNIIVIGLGMSTVIYCAAIVFKFLFEDPYSQLLKITFCSNRNPCEKKDEVKNNNNNKDGTKLDELEKQTSSATSENK